MKKSNSQLRPALLALSIALTTPLVLTGCGEATASVDKEEKVEEVIKVPVETTAALRGDIANYYAANAIMESIDEADVIAKVHGLVEVFSSKKATLLKRGKFLRKLTRLVTNSRFNNVRQS